MATFCSLRSLLGLQKLVCSVSPFYPMRSYSSSPFGRIGFIGLGNMGARMADSLIKDGYEVAVHDINHNIMKMFSDKGVLTEDLPLKVAESSDVVITMLPSSNHVLDVYTGKNGFLSGGNLLRPRLFIDSSTIDPQTSRKVSAAVSNCSLIDKRVSPSSSYHPGCLSTLCAVKFQHLDEKITGFEAGLVALNRRIVVAENNISSLESVVLEDLMMSKETLLSKMEETTLIGGCGLVSSRETRIEAPKPKEFRGDRSAQDVENFLWQMDAYFEHVNITSEAAKIRMTAM
ncbi:hypothetical protein MTR67_007557 [Solanum verrucosum]|uniref:3-hydroxyisobutyrate dehydrogenase n=1 Tax=Solanum verrucosum TaxID=315347 RepID=A0AAF0Q008_SOLVR|nr:hypothetical protein MTR67_007557 [Solanum verrucosum]